MTVSTTINKVVYIGNGIATSFAIPFPFLEKEHLKVYQRLNNVQSERTDWVISDGNMIFETAPFENAQIVIMREVPFTQETDYRENEILPAETLEKNFDNLTMQVQQLKEQADRAVTVSMFSDSNPSEIVSKIEALYDVKEQLVTTANNINAIVLSSAEIEAIKDAPEQAAAAIESAENAAKSASASSAYADSAHSDADIAQMKYEAAAQAADKAEAYAQKVQFRNIGDIFYTSRLDVELNGAVEANGGVYAVSDFRGEQSVCALLAEGKLPYVSMGEYESIVSEHGSCRAFGWDNGDTFRVPTVKALLLTDEQAAVVGNGMTLGLTDGTNNVGTVFWNGSQHNGNIVVGSAYGTNVGDSISGSTSATNKAMGVTTDPEKSGIVSNLDVIEYRAMVQLSTGVKEDATQLKEYKFNNPHFFGQSIWTDIEPHNASWLLSNGAFHSGATYVDFYQWLLKIHNGVETIDGVSVKGVDDEYTDYDFIINTADTTFRLPLKTKLASGSAVVGNGMTLGITDGAKTGGLAVTTLQSHQQFNATTDAYGINVGSAITNAISFSNLTSLGITTDTEKSGIETASDGLKLYFYIGDMVQDAHLINAGGVLSDVAEVKGRPYVIETYRNGTEWYRLYSDGWIEQGVQVIGATAGNTTVNFLKRMADTDYNVAVGLVCSSSNSGNMYGWLKNKAVDSIGVYCMPEDNYITIAGQSA